MEQLYWKSERWEMLKGMRQCVERKYHSQHGEFLVNLRVGGFNSLLELEDHCWDMKDRGYPDKWVGLTRELWDEIPAYRGSTEKVPGRHPAQRQGIPPELAGD